MSWSTNKQNDIEAMRLELENAALTMQLSEETKKIIMDLILTRKGLVHELLTLTPTIRKELMNHIWLNNEILKSFNQYMSKMFITENEVFLEFKNFLENNFPMFDLKVYRYEENESKRNLKEILSGREKIDLNSIDNNNYVLELEALESENFIVNHEDPQSNTFASTKIEFESFDWKKDIYIISFNKNTKFYSNIRHNSQFTSKLEILFKKAWIWERIVWELSSLQIFIDWLTGIYNQKFIKLIKNWEYIILAIDINDFKKYNDTLWHTQWDIALKEFSRVLESAVRKDHWDVIARKGWDEFIVFIKIDDANNTKETAETIKQRIQNELFLLNEKKRLDYELTLKNDEHQENVKDLRFYITIWHSLFDEDKTFEERFKEADFKMYESKDEQGRMHRIVSQFREFLKKTKNHKMILKLFSLLSEEFTKWHNENFPKN